MRRVEVEVKFPLTNDFDKIERNISALFPDAKATDSGAGMGMREVIFEVPEKVVNAFIKKNNRVFKNFV